jgi:hypothetical protein
VSDTTKVQSSNAAGFKINLSTYQPINLTASFAKYVAIKSAPARFMEVSISMMALFSSIQPILAAAFIMAYSPLMLYALTGTYTAFFT